MSDDTDLGEVWAVASPAAANIAVVEISQRPDVGNPRVSALREEPRSLRREARTF